MTLPDLPSTETDVHKHRTASTVVETEYSWLQNMPAQPSQHYHESELPDLPSTETGVNKHHTTSNVVKTEFCHVPG